jgi:PAS domain S-box-containing protein
METQNKQSPNPGKYTALLFGVLMLSGLYLTSLHSYLLFHSLVDLFVVVIIFSVFVLAWNSRKMLDNDYLLFIGIGFLFVGILYLFHILAYKGMGVFQGYGANLPTQLWIAARYLTGLTFLLAPLFIRKRLNSPITFAAYISVTVLLFASIFYWKVFPDCFIEKTGLTNFKKTSEYVVNLMFLASLGFLLQRQEAFDKKTLRMLVLSILMSVVQGLFFMTYASVYAFSNMIGHYFGVFSFYFIYRAIILTGLTRPLDLIFRNLNQSKEALSGSEKEFRGMFELSAVGMAQVDPKTNRFIRVNNTFCDICGHSADELYSLTFSDITHPEDRQKDFDAFQRAVRRETDGFKIEKRYIRKDGAIVWVNVTGSIIFDENGQPVRTAAVIEDVTERKGALEALRTAHVKLESRVRERTEDLKKLNEALETEIAGRMEINTMLAEQSKLLESFFRHTPTCLVFLDREFNFIRVNEAYARACGRNASDFFGHNHFELYPSDELKEKFQGVVETKRPYTVFARPFTFPDHPEWGVSYWDLSVVPILDESDEVEFLVFSLRDITEQKESEKRVEITNKLLQMFVPQVSRKDYINYVVQVLQEWSGCRCLGIRVLDESSKIPYEAYVGFSDEFMRTENFLSLEHDQCACIRVVRNAPDPADAAMMTGNGSFYCNDTFEFVNALSEKEKSRFRGVCVQVGFKSVAVIPIVYREKIFGAIHLADEREGMVALEKVELIESLSLIIGEVIYRLNAEEALRISQEQLRNLAAHLQSAREDERTRIAREIHDELGQIMTALKIDLSWLRDKYCDHAGLCEKTKSMLSQVDATIRSVKKIITELRPGILDHLGISAAIEWQAAEFQEISGIPCSVVIIPDQIVLNEELSTNIFRIFQEILTNIMRHAEATNVDVLFEKRDGLITLSVEDNGKGIDIRQINRPTSFGIMGIRERVNIMSGDIEIVGTRGRGTSISITIPVPVDLNIDEQESLQY